LNGEAAYIDQIWPMGLFMILSLMVAGAMMGISFVLGQRHSGRVTNEPYESGIPPTGETDVPFVKYYLLAIFFVIFDVEAVFLFAWAVAIRELGWQGYWAVLFFIGLLLLLLFYLWRTGLLDWGKVTGRVFTEGRRS
jgi:NADH-quinone oxidoreductase subunit A